MSDKTDAVAAVEAAFRDAHKSAEKALIDAGQLLQAWLKAGRVVGVHPNDTSETTQEIGEAIAGLSNAVLSLAAAHHMAQIARDEAIEKGLLPPIILPQGGGGGGKNWP